MNDSSFITIVVVIGFVIGFLSHYGFANVDTLIFKKEAVEHHYAHWDVSSSGTTKFTWNKEQK